MALFPCPLQGLGNSCRQVLRGLQADAETQQAVAVGVRGREPPSAAAGLDRSQHSDAVVAFHPVQAGLDPFDGCRVEVVGEGADHADMVGAAAPRLVSRW